MVARRLMCVLAVAMVSGMSACNRAEAPSSPAPTGQLATADAPAPVHAPMRPSSQSAGPVLTVSGVRFVIPEGWQAENVEPGPLAAEAAFRLSPADGDSAPVTVRITHYPNMKGMDAANIQRWIAQVKRPDGPPYAPNEVTPTAVDLGNVKLSIIDLTGTVASGMGASGAGLPDHRMIAAIVDHPQGPHFVKAVGSVRSMSHWEKSIDSFLRSASTP